MLQAVKDYYRAGVTSAHDAAIGYFRDADQILVAYEQLVAENRLPLRTYLTVVEADFQRLLKTAARTTVDSQRLKFGAVKFFQDGSIQALTAALEKPYQCRPEQRGSLIHSQEALDAYVETYHRRGYQIAIHANGDRAIESALRALERACTRFTGKDLRHMIIHCQMANRNQLQRMKQIGAMPSFFVNHVYYWGDRHADLFLGNSRAKLIDPLATAVKTGLPFTLHSDLPITPVDPLFSMHCAVNRQTRAGVVLGADERIQPLEALKAYTIWAARCSFEEAEKGSIKEGKLADFAVLSGNPLLTQPDTINNIQVLQTVIGGTTVYSHPSIAVRRSASDFNALE
jgi:predicted amidohydrolase YtcJ